MRRLCLGGTFDPIHLGHTRCAAAAALDGGFDQIVLIPANISPHKSAEHRAAPSVARLNMCQIAAKESNDAAGRDLFRVEDIELRREPPSYTIDTVRALKSDCGWTEVNWLIGGDQLAALPRWHSAESLMTESRLWIMARPNFDFDFKKLPDAFAELKNRVLRAPLVDISATEIRRRVRAGEAIDDLVGPAVAKWIASNRLYCDR